MIARTWQLAGVIAGLALLGACGRSEMDGEGQVSPGAGGAGGTGGAGGVPGSCGEADCLDALFATCVPEGDCAAQAASSPSASSTTICYDNGVTVSYTASYSGSAATLELTVRRRGQVCYTIEASGDFEASAFDYVVRDRNGKQVASVTPADKAGSITVVCNGRAPVTIDGETCGPSVDANACRLATCP